MVQLPELCMGKVSEPHESEVAIKVGEPLMDVSGSLYSCARRRLAGQEYRSERSG
jgi:hypothetical protein